MTRNRIKQVTTAQTSDVLADAHLMQYTHKAMTAKLQAQRAEGFSGWYTTERTLAMLKKSLKENMARGDWLDVAIIAAMINMRLSCPKEKK